MKKAFTLIEVMVVLSILAIVSILAYNFFGSTIKEAKMTAAITQMENMLNDIADCYEKYYMDNGTYPGNTMVTDFVDNGCLQSIPVPPIAAWGGANYDEFKLNPFPQTNGNAYGPVGLEAYYTMKQINDDFCSAWNEKHLGDPNTNVTWDFVGPKGCDKYTSATNRRIMWYLREIN